MYGNYDGKNELPFFELHLGVKFWTVVNITDPRSVFRKEIIHKPSTDILDICAVKTKSSSPFISVLELRPLPSVYETPYQFLVLFRRVDFGSTNSDQIIRYNDDIYDRIWTPLILNNSEPIKASFLSGELSTSNYRLPASVMTTAVRAKENFTTLSFKWIPLISRCYVFLHFTEVEQLQTGEMRKFNIYLNNDLWKEGIVPEYQKSITESNTAFIGGTTLEILLNQTSDSTLPPIFNAVEVFMEYDSTSPGSPTFQQDVDASRDIKSYYNVKKQSWQGDPCAPRIYSWEGLNCSYDGTPRIISLNLSSSGLTDKEIAPSIFNLTLIQTLDLSNNSIKGKVPNFLSELQYLRILNLAGNDLEGSVPAALIEAEKNKTLQLSLGDNPKLCYPDPCKKKSNFVPIVIASIAAVLVLLTVFFIIWRFRWKIQAQFNKSEEEHRPLEYNTSVLEYNTSVVESSDDSTPLEFNNRQLTFSEVVNITNNFEKAIGKGGFGTVYYGHLNNIPVAVKMLAHSSGQGSKQFRAEARLLMTVHHKNLTTLVGYCDESTNKGLIYEYMANGNLHTHLSGKKPNVLSWENRIQIAIDAAQGLEYLHNGIKPQVIHRDVKSTNILLNEKFQAKIGDFGLSRILSLESKSHEITDIVGTIGYLDPEYYGSYRMNEKSDVYSFGIVLLELITGKPAIIKGDVQIHLTDWIAPILAKGDIENIVDKRLRGNFDMNSVWKALEIAMACSSENSFERPTMDDVVIELKKCLEMKNSNTSSAVSIGKISSNLESRMIPKAR